MGQSYAEEFHQGSGFDVPAVKSTYVKPVSLLAAIVCMPYYKKCNCGLLRNLYIYSSFNTCILAIHLSIYSTVVTLLIHPRLSSHILNLLSL